MANRGTVAPGTLTDKETEVLRIAWEHRASNDQIAAHLGISSETVKTHLRNIRAKTGLNKAAAAQALFSCPPPKEGSPVLGIEPGPRTSQTPEAVREDRTAFISSAFGRNQQRAKNEQSDLAPAVSITLSQVIRIAVGLAIIALAAKPLVKSVEDLANSISPPTIYRSGR